MCGLLWKLYYDAETEERGRASGTGAPLPGKSPYRLDRLVHDPAKLTDGRHRCQSLLAFQLVSFYLADVLLTIAVCGSINPFAYRNNRVCQAMIDFLAVAAYRGRSRILEACRNASQSALPAIP